MNVSQSVKQLITLTINHKVYSIIFLFIIAGRKKTITVVLMTQELTQLKDELNCLEQIRNGRTNCMSCNDLIRSIRSAKFHRQTSVSQFGQMHYSPTCINLI